MIVSWRLGLAVLLIAAEKIIDKIEEYL
jgi:hypothetical protein